ncbi:hypothetical protein KAS08_04600 [Candidatus Pacearchaeota archaeon]|nr:hypothetical protein [Candidatus Pacearchaeota archaeon]
MVVIEKLVSCGVDLDLSSFLKKDFSGTNFSPILLSKDLRTANIYYNAFRRMVSEAEDLKNGFDFSPVPLPGYFIVDPNGVAANPFVDFFEINNFSRYILDKYKL